MKITRINVLSLAKIMTAMHALFGLVIGALSTVMALTGFQPPPEMGAPPLMGVASVLILPILYALIGFVSGAVSAFVFNLVAGRLGGLEIEVEETSALRTMDTD